MKSPEMKSPKPTICPCCGERTACDLRAEGCPACGALAVGPPLARPEQVLPAYGLPLAVAASGALIALLFAASTAFALSERKPFSLAFWDLVGAAQTAAWRMKLVVLPLSALAAWAGARALARIRREPLRYAGERAAAYGFALTLLVAVGTASLIGVTVPERLRHRRLAAEAVRNAEAYDSIRVLLEYQQQYGSLPGSAEDLKKLPDRDGSVARAAEMISAGAYEPEATIAALPQVPGKRRGLRGASVELRPASLRPGINDLPAEGLPFTNYTLRLAGLDNLLGTDDDVYVRDGVIVPAPNEPAAAKRAAPAAAKETKLP
jgi:hypothetical protein